MAGAEVRAAILIPSQVAVPRGTIAIACGIAPDVGMAGSEAPFTVGIEPLMSPELMLPVDPMCIEPLFDIEVVVGDPAVAAFAAPWTVWANAATATNATAITPATRAERPTWLLRVPCRVV
jgi:hypothetical protein